MSTPENVTLNFDGVPVAARPGQSVGAALTGAGILAWRDTRRAGRPRGLFCGIGICFDCLLTVDGVANQRACLTPVRDGMELRSTGGHASPARSDGAGDPQAADGGSGR